MIIEIRKAGFHNKGAELMLLAAWTKLKIQYPDAKFVMAPTSPEGSQPFEKFTQLGFYPKAFLWRKGRQWGKFAKFIPAKLRAMYGLVLDAEIDVVIDAAGFSYSDQWGSQSVDELAASLKNWKKTDAKVILLPQAFGPYTSKNIRQKIKFVGDNVDLAFPRDRISREHLSAICGDQPHIKQYPDFTNLLQGVIPSGYDSSGRRFCIVPNKRMLDKTNKNSGSIYVNFLIKCAKYLEQKHAKPFILIHEQGDREIAAQIQASVPAIEIISEADPLKIKGILGTCDGTIGSRFHGLVSALSQGIPCLATGWSHKYQMLFEEYGFPEGLIDVSITDADLHEKIDALVNFEQQEVIREKITRNAEKLKLKSVEMWEEVFKTIDSRSYK